MVVPEFRNEPLTDFSQPGARQAMEQALSLVRSQLGRHHPLNIGGRAVDTPERILSVNPGRKDQVVGTVAKASRQHAEEAVSSAWQAFGPWSQLPATARAAILFRAAAIMRRRKLELAAWEVYEAGKTWPEADADVAEAIDFLEYYGRQAIRLEERVPTTALPGEMNETFYIPLGVGLVIPPWNFPLAILTGTTVGPVAAGNTVILKPSSNTPVIGAKFMEIMREAGLPDGVINFLPGPGPEVGDYLVNHPRIRFINFTGSMEVGLRIYEQAARLQPGQVWLKRVVAEMGGKDAILVDESADLDEAAHAIVVSAFGFQGQKCSACSRVIAVDAVYDQLLQRVVDKTTVLRVGQADDPATQVGPVIDQLAFNKIMGYIDMGRREGRLVAGGHGDDREGYFVWPTIFADVDGQATIAQEEIFGPVVAFIRARDFEHALQIANNTRYALTGSVFARDRYKLELAKRHFHVGNLYFNRKCTGSLVGVHPFGGWNLSGTDAKAGGPDYLTWFMQLKSVAEKLS